MQLSETIYQAVYGGIDRFGILLDAVLIVYLMNHYFVRRWNNISDRIWYVVSTVVIVLWIYLTGYGRSFAWFVGSIFAALILYAMLCFKGTVYRRLSVCCVYGTLYFVTDSIYMPLYNRLLQSLGDEPYVLGLGMVIFRRVLCKGIMYLLITFLLKNAAEEETVLPPAYRGCMYVFCGFDLALLSLDIFYMQGGASAPAVFNSFFMAVCFALILSFFYLFTSLVKSYQTNISSRLRVKEEELHEQYLEQTQELITASRQFRHDMKAHIFCMQGLLEQKKYEELDQYLSQFADSQFLHLPFIAYCADDSINTILNQKVHQAQEEKLPLEVKVQLSNQFTVEKLDLCTVISNLCDNAIEAVRGLDSPKIRLELQETKGYLSLKVTNPSPYNVLEENPGLHTTKADSENHGLGMQIVRNIIEKYHGMMDVTWEDGQFCCFCLMENGE